MAWRRLLFAVFGLLSLATASVFFFYKERHPAGAAQMLGKSMALKLPQTTLGDHTIPAPTDTILFDAKGNYALVGHGWKGAVNDSELAGGTSLAVVVVSTQKERQVTNLMVRDAFFDPSGDMAYFVTDAFDIYRLTIPDGAPEKIAEHALASSLSPDGGMLVYQKLNDDWQPGDPYDAAKGITVMRLDTRKETRVTNRWEDYLPTWTPDSLRLVYFTPDGNGLLHPAVVKNDGKENVPIAVAGGLRLAVPSERPQWSADGSKLLYESDRQINLVTFDPSRLRITASKSLGYGKKPEWSPDGKSVRFLVGSGGDFSDSTSIRVNLEGMILR